MNGSGTIQDPYQITTASELNDMRFNLAAHYKLMNDIDLTGVSWDPVGTPGAPFTGSLDGSGYKITGLNINSQGDYVGLFGLIEWADPAVVRVKDLVIENATVTGRDYVGILAGAVRGVFTDQYQIKNVSVSGVCTGRNITGGLVGEAFKVYFYRCRSYAAVTGQLATGGFVGRANGQEEQTSPYTTRVAQSHFQYCYACGNVTNTNTQLSEGAISGVASATGGFVGQAANSGFYGCFATGNVSGGWRCGGFMGAAVMQNAYPVSLRRCYARGDVDGLEQVGGFVGYARGWMSQDIYCTGAVLGANASQRGAVFGYLDYTPYAGWTPYFRLYNTPFYDSTNNQAPNTLGGVGRPTESMTSDSGGYSITFAGQGLNDLVFGGTYSGSSSATFDVKISMNQTHETFELIVTKGAQVSGNVNIKINNDDYPVPVQAGDSAEAVASKIAEGSPLDPGWVHAGYTVTASGTKVVFRCNIAGAQADAVFEALGTGVQATLTTILQGGSDAFIWRLNGSNWSDDIGITGGWQELSDGVMVMFGSTTGHTVNDMWSASMNAPGWSASWDYFYSYWYIDPAKIENDGYPQLLAFYDGLQGQVVLRVVGESLVTVYTAAGIAYRRVYEQDAWGDETEIGELTTPYITDLGTVAGARLDAINNPQIVIDGVATDVNGTSPVIARTAEDRGKLYCVGPDGRLKQHAVKIKDGQIEIGQQMPIASDNYIGVMRSCNYGGLTHLIWRTKTTHRHAVIDEATAVAEEKQVVSAIINLELGSPIVTLDLEVVE